MVRDTKIGQISTLFFDNPISKIRAFLTFIGTLAFNRNLLINLAKEFQTQLVGTTRVAKPSAKAVMQRMRPM